MTANITMYTTRSCPYCIIARQILNKKNIDFTDIAVDGKPELRQEMREKSLRRTVPQIWINQEHIGGCTELMALNASGELEDMLVNNV